MITDMTIMLYVNDVESSSTFWQRLGFEEALRQDLGEGHITVLLMYGEMGAAIQLYDLEYIRATQPELADRKPVVIFSAEVIDDLYEHAKSASSQVSEIAPYGDQSFFTVADPDGNVYTVMGEHVDEPATDEDIEAFNKNISGLTELGFDDIEDLTEPGYIFFGRATCPWSRRMAKQFPQFKTPMYFVDTEGTAAELPARQKYGVKTVPTVIKRASNGMYVKFDNEGKQSLAAFLGEKE